jgi:transcriptional regulator with XRE-family HTH domain
MSTYTQAAGQLLRRLRQQRQLKLREIAPKLHSSIATLSRKERGEEEIERSDVQRAIEVFQLTPWEAHQLWTAAGFIPEIDLLPAHEYDLRAFAEAMLAQLYFPAFIMDAIGYVQAWNQGIEAIWAPSQSVPHPHVISDLFSERVRTSMGDQWAGYVQQSLAVFYHKTLRVANDPAFRQLLADLVEAYSDEFVSLWNAAQQYDYLRNGALPLELGGTVVRYPSPVGLIEYLVMQSVFQFPSRYELYLYVPLGAENQARYAQFQALMGEERLYFWEG